MLPRGIVKRILEGTTGFHSSNKPDSTEEDGEL
jgi:hypothetical protein